MVCDGSTCVVSGVCYACLECCVAFTHVTRAEVHLKTPFLPKFPSQAPPSPVRSLLPSQRNDKLVRIFSLSFHMYSTGNQQLHWYVPH